MTTPLDRYMTQNGIKDHDLASRIGRSRTLVSKLRRGRHCPTLEIAAVIETETGGEVPMRSWVADVVHDPACAAGERAVS